MEAAAWGPVERKQHGHLLYWEDIVKTLVPPPHLLYGQHNVTNMTNMTDKTKITNMTNMTDMTNMTLVTYCTGKILSRLWSLLLTCYMVNII